MSFTYRSSTSGGNASGGAVTINKPSGVVSGDLLIVAAYLESDTNTWTPGSGFTALADQVNTGLFSLQVWYRWADGTEPASWTWTPASSNWRTIVCAAWSGGPGSGAPLDLASGAQGDGDLVSNQLAPSVTTTAADDLLLFVYGNYSGISPGDTTGTATNMRVTLGGLTIGDATIASAGATGTSGPDSAVGTEDWAALHIALLSAASGPASITLTGIASGEAFGIPVIGDVTPGTHIGKSTPPRRNSRTSVRLLRNPRQGSDVEIARYFGEQSTSIALTLTGIASAEAFGAPALAVDLALTGIASDEDFGTPTIGAAAASITLAGIASAEAYGAPTLSVVVAPLAVASGEAFGQPSTSAVVSLDGVASAEAFGVPTVGGAPVSVVLTGIASDEAYGTPALSVSVVPSGIASAEMVGTPSASVVVSLVGVASGEAFGAPTISGAAASVVLVGVASGEAFGLPALTVNVAPVGFEGGAFGEPHIGVVLALTGISSSEAFGIPSLSIAGVLLVALALAPRDEGLSIGERGFALAVGQRRGMAVGDRDIDLGVWSRSNQMTVDP